MSAEVATYQNALHARGVAKLWQRVFGESTGGQDVAWLFRANPAGECVRVVAVENGQVVGHAGTFPVRFRCLGQPVRGAYSVAAMTAASQRGRGVYRAMGEALYAALEAQDYAFVAGFSNANSHRLMTGPLGRVPLRPFPWCVKLLGTGGALRCLTRRPLSGSFTQAPAPLEGSAVEVRACSLDEPAIEAVWKAVEAEVGVGAVRDVAFSRWRYLSRGDAGYRAALASSGGKAVAFCVYRLLPVRGVPACFLMDLQVAPKHEDAGEELLRWAEGHARRCGAGVMSALLPSRGTAAAVLQRSRYLRIPERLHPQTIRFSVRGLGEMAGCRQLSDASAWTLGWSDTDVV